jgi:biotin operon repressor
MKPEGPPRGVLAAQALITVEGMLRILRAAGDAYGHDYEAILIYWSVAIASVGRYLRSDDLITLIESGGPLPEDEHHAISARAIAEATGLPRETVRRKIAHLVADGHLVQDRRGVRTYPGLLDQRGNDVFARVATREIRRMATAMETMVQLSEKTTGRD